MFKNIYYGWWIVLSCSLIGIFVGGAVFFGFTAFFEPIRDEFGWSYTQISLASSLQGLEMGIFAPVIGFLVDRFGARTMIFWGIIIVGLGFLLLSSTQSLLVFYAAFLLISFGAGGCTAVVTTTVLANWFYRKIGTALGLMGAGNSAGGAVVFLIVYLIEIFQWRTTLIILAAGIVLTGIPVSLIIRNRPEDYGYLPDGEPSSPHVFSTQAIKATSEITLRHALRKRTFLFLNIVEITRMVAASATMLHVMPYLSSQGIQRSTSALIAGAVPILGIIGRLGFGWMGDVFNKRFMMALTYVFLSLGMLFFSYAQGTILIILFLLFFAPGLGGSMVMRGAILRGYFGRNSFGKLLGIVMGSGALGGMVGPTLAGFAFDLSGSYHLIWLIFSVLTGFSAILILNISEDRETQGTD